MGIYPFKIKINDPKLDNILTRLQKDRICPIDKKMSKSLGWKIKPIRKDIRIVIDRSYDNQSFIQASPFVKIKKKKGNYIFNKIF